MKTPPQILILETQSEYFQIKCLQVIPAPRTRPEGLFGQFHEWLALTPLIVPSALCPTFVFFFQPPQLPLRPTATPPTKHKKGKSKAFSTKHWPAPAWFCFNEIRIDLPTHLAQLLVAAILYLPQHFNLISMFSPEKKAPNEKKYQNRNKKWRAAKCKRWKVSWRGSSIRVQHFVVSCVGQSRWHATRLVLLPPPARTFMRLSKR